MILFPVGLTLSGFEAILQRTDVWFGYLNTIIYTVLTVVLSLVVTIPAGWALSRKRLWGKKFFMIYFIIPMFFGGGLIPFYNVMSSLKLINTAWSVILPSILSVWNLFMTRTFFESSIPDGLVEAARIDGASEFRIFFSLVLPCPRRSWPSWRCTTPWASGNSYFNAMIFLQDENLYPLQLILRENPDRLRDHHRRQRRDHPGAVPSGPTRSSTSRSLCPAPPVIMLYPLRPEVFQPGRHDRLAEGLIFPVRTIPLSFMEVFQ